MGVAGGNEALEFGLEAQVLRQLGVAIGNADDADIAFDSVSDLLEDRCEVVVHQNHVVVGVVDGVKDLLGRQPDVDGVKDRAHHRYGEEALEIAIAVPVHDGYRHPWLDTDGSESVGQSPEALNKRRVVVPHAIAKNDLAVRGQSPRGMEEMTDQ
jgi:hypothetical protein